jgi:MFS family permease
VDRYEDGAAQLKPGAAVTSSLWALNTLNFFMADVADGLGPFLGVYLQGRQWSPGEIGLVMTVGGFAGMLATAPLGALVDRIIAKRALVASGALIVVAASLTIYFIPGFAFVMASQVATGIAAAAIAPAIPAITLGIVGQAGFARQNSRNQASNHMGNVAAAALAGGLGYWFGFEAVFAVLAGMTVGSLAAVMCIDPRHIDYRAARGLSGKQDASASAWSVLVTCTPLLVLAATLALFHLGNAAMLPLLGQALVDRGVGSPSGYTGATILIAQATMVPMALLAGWLAQKRGYWMVFLLALVALPLRGAIAGLLDDPIVIFPVQMLDGVGAGLLGVAVPGLVARILNGTGHINAGLGAVMTVQGVGASLSPALGGFVAGRIGYSASFLVLGAIALVALTLWLAARPVTVNACKTA